MVFFNCFKCGTQETIHDTIPFVNWESARVNCQEDDVLLKELFGYMVSGLTAHKIEILQEYKNENHENISEIAHRIKGDSATLACENLTSHSAILQIRPDVKENMDNLIKSIDKTIEAINTRYP